MNKKNWIILKKLNKIKILHKIKKSEDNNINCFDIEYYFFLGKYICFLYYLNVELKNFKFFT